MGDKRAGFGAISTGTRQANQLFEACITALKEVAPGKAKVLRKAWNDIPKECVEEHNGERCSACDESYEGFVHGELWEAMVSEAPAYGYFGWHDGDSNKLGYWLDEREYTEALRTKKAIRVQNEDQIPPRYDGDVFMVDDNGDSITYMVWRSGRGYVQWRIE